MKPLVEHHIDAMVTGEDEDRNTVGNCALACMMCEVVTNAIDFPMYHTTIEARCACIRIRVQNLNLAPSFKRLVKNRNSLEYSLVNQFVETLPQQPHFNVPEPALCYIYTELNKTASKESSKDNE